MAITLKVTYVGTATLNAANYESTADAQKQIAKAIHAALAAHGRDIFTDVKLELGR